MMRRMAAWTRRFLRGPRSRTGRGDRGITMIELAIMSLIVTIALVAITDAIRVASRGTLMAKEKARAMALARDRLEEVKNMGYLALKSKVSNYVWPDQPDPDHPLYQRKDAIPYPAAAPSIEEDPWTPEVVLLGAVKYWRHVKVKFVAESGPAGELVQFPDVSEDGIGGTGIQSNLALVEVDITWESRRTGKMEQIRLTTLVANLSVGSNANGKISGSIWDDDCGGANCDADGVDGGSVDDKWITWGYVVVTARHLTTGQTYSTASNVGGKGGWYQLTALPNGSYLVEMSGGSIARDSAYNGAANPSYVGPSALPVDVTPTSPEVEHVDIWTNHAESISVVGRFIDVAGSPATPHDIRIGVDDGTSQPVTFTITNTCTASPPDECWFEVPNVAWPPTGTKLHTVTFEDLTAGTINTVQYCADSTANPVKDVYLGEDPGAHGDNPCNGTGGVCSGMAGWLQCVTPNPGWLPISVTGKAAVPAAVQVKVLEYYNGASKAFTDVSKVRVELTAVSANVGVTLMIATNGTTTFKDAANGIVPVPVAPGGITVRAYMTTTGWSTDTFSLPFATVSGATYYLEESGPAGLPDEDQRHTFVLQRVAEISGTVWEVDGVKPYSYANVVIRNAITEWSATVKCDVQGRFSHTGVPQEATSYTIEPVGGADFISSPPYRTVDVNANGVTFRNDFMGDPLEFTLNAVNAHIVGTVSKTTAGNLVKSGAVVIASTYAGAFPTTLPSTLLGGQYSYSTVTMTDGTYRVRVATGVGTYRMYSYMMWNGVLSMVEQVGPVSVTPGADTTQNLVLP